MAPVTGFGKRPQDRSALPPEHDRRGAWIAMAVLTAFQIVDGIDLVGLSLTASSIRNDWPVPDALLGTLLAAAQFGAIFAAMVVGRLSDRLGVRNALVIAAVLMTAGSLTTAVAQGNAMLLVSRIMTGVGLGGALPLTIGYIGRNFPLKIRPIAIIIVTSGLAAGQMTAGILAGPIIQGYGWRAMFWLGAMLSTLIVPALFLLRSDERGAEEQHHASAKRSGSGLRFLWQSEHRRQLVVDLLLCCNGSIVFYFLVSWMPTLLQRQGMALQSASLATTFLSAGGLAGSFVVGPLIGKAPFRVVGGAFSLAGVLLAAAALLPIPPVAVLAGCLVLGITLVAAYLSMGVFMTTVFPTRTHVHISGISTVVSRTGGIVGPMAAGALLAAGLGERPLFLIAALLVASAGITAFLSNPAQAAR